MSRTASRVEIAIHELEAALAEYLSTEVRQGEEESERAASILWTTSPWLIEMLLNNLPTLAHPWRLVDMHKGNAIRMARAGYQGDIAVAYRTGRNPAVWRARVSERFVLHENGAPWPSLEAAKKACDEQLRASGVKLVDEVTS